MTQKQEKFLTEKYIRPMVRKMLKEGNEDLEYSILKVLKKYGMHSKDAINCLEDIMEEIRLSPPQF